MDYESSSASNRHEDNPNGYKIVVSNLHPRVTEEDILELFSDIGPIKRARFLDKGIAEVLYVKIEHAKEAIYKYDKNELDGKKYIWSGWQNLSKTLFSRWTSLKNIGNRCLLSK